MNLHMMSRQDCVVCRADFGEICRWLQGAGFTILGHDTNWLKISAPTNYRPTIGGPSDESDRLYCFVAGYKDLTCELCGKPMAIQYSRHGKFHGCTEFPRCEGKQSLTYRDDIYQVY